MAAVVSDGSRIEFEVTGDGPPLVLLHGFSGDRITANRLRRAEVAVLPGCGHFGTFTRLDLTVLLSRDFLSRLRP